MFVPAICSNGSWIIFWDMWKAIALVLFTLSDSLLAFSQLYYFANSSFIESFMFILVISVVLSAKFMNLHDSLELIMSFMYIINRRGPKIESWGTPITISVFRDIWYVS